MKKWLWIGGAVALALGIWLVSIDWIQGDPQSEHHVPGGDAEEGRRLLYQWACGSCHVIPGVAGAEGMVGPPLTDWAARQYIAGTMRNRPPELIRWIMDPTTVEPGTGMPDMGVPEDAARHMAAYLYTVGDANPLGPPHPFPLRWLEKLGKVRQTGPND